MTVIFLPSCMHFYESTDSMISNTQDGLARHVYMRRVSVTVQISSATRDLTLIQHNKFY